MSERLTLANSFGEDVQFCDGCDHFGEPNGCNKAGGECESYLVHQDIYQRLFDIENILYDADRNEIIPLDRLRAIAEAERDGRLVVLPCKVGDSIFILDTDWVDPICKYTVDWFDVAESGIYLYTNEPEETGVIEIGRIGKTEVFPRQISGAFWTREAAEAALSAGKGE